MYNEEMNNEEMNNEEMNNESMNQENVQENVQDNTNQYEFQQDDLYNAATGVPDFDQIKKEREAEKQRHKQAKLAEKEAKKASKAAGNGGGSSTSIGKFIAFAAILGLVCGLCFFGAKLTYDKLINKSDSSQIGTTNQYASTGVTTATGGVITTGSATDVSAIVQNVMPAVVSISSTVEQQGYFGQTQEGTSSGSGFIVAQDEKSLLVVTNNHVIDGAKQIKVTFINNVAVEATVKGTDSTADLALLSIPADKLTNETKAQIKVATLGDSETTKVGEMVVAIGNALGYGQSVTVGYVSAKNREVQVSSESSSSQSSQGSKTMTLLQTDAAINPGNSGGCLLNLNGEVIGINSVKYASEDVEGMGYSIPISKAVPIINELMKKEVLTESEKGYIGISGTTVSDSASQYYGLPVGVYVYEVAKNSGAETGGLVKGDIITKINDISVTTIDDLKEKANGYRVGTEVTLTIERSDNGTYKEQTVKVTLQSSDSVSSLNNSTTQDNQSQQNDNSGSFGYQLP